MASKPKYKYFIYKARKRFGNKIYNIEVSKNHDIYLVIRVYKEIPIQKSYNEGVFKWEITSYIPTGYKSFGFLIHNDVIQHTKFNKILDFIENEIKK